MATAFFITGIKVNFPGTGYDYDPLVYRYNAQNQIIWGYACPNQLTLEDPIKIHKAGAPLPSGNSFIQIATSRGQYQIYWNDGDPTTPYIILLQSLTSPKAYPANQSSLWAGKASSMNFNLNIDMTQLDKGDGISLVPAT